MGIGSTVVSSELPPPFESSLMRPNDNVIDFASYRKRRQARRMAELMWTMYATRAGLAAFQITQAVNSSETRQA
jgi:hypothetical protein